MTRAWPIALTALPSSGLKPIEPASRKRELSQDRQFLLTPLFVLPGLALQRA